MPVAAFSLIFTAAQLAGSVIGGIRETQEMLDFCAEHGIASDIEMIDSEDQRSLRAPAEERREISLRDRYGFAEEVNPARKRRRGRLGACDLDIRASPTIPG